LGLRVGGRISGEKRLEIACGLCAKQQIGEANRKAKTYETRRRCGDGN
jgi:hypothetical protein